VLLSNGPLGSALPQAQGLAAADKAAGNDRVTICTVSDGASMEGEAKEAFAAIPGLASQGKLNPFVMIISDNDTKLSGRISKDSYPMEPTFQSLHDLGWRVIKVPFGHDLAAVLEAVEMGIKDAKVTPTKPVALWVKTIKGYGVKSTEESSSGGHGFPLSNGEKIIDFVNEIYDGAANVPAEFANWAKALRADWEQKEARKKAAAPAPATAAPKKEKVQAGISKACVKAAQKGYPIFSISADLAGSTGMSGFQKSLPGRSIDVGVAEANMISTGAGMAKVGFIPVVDTFGQFGITKGNLPLTMAALSQAPVIAIFSHVGFQDAADGASHQGLTYFAATSPIPHTIVIAPSCADEAEALMYQAIERYAADRTAGKDGETYIFFVGRENYPLSWVEGATYPWGAAQVLRKGKDVTLIGCGPLLNAAIEAGKKLAAEGIEATVINNPFVNKVDLETIGSAVKNGGGRLVTIEDHQLINGMGAQVSHALSEAGIAHTIKTLAVHGEFGQSAYTAQELYNKHGLTADGMVAAAKKLMGR
jgi:transketolase